MKEKNENDQSSALTPEPLLNEKEIAAALRVSLQTVRQMRRFGGGPEFFKLNGKSVRYPLSSLQQYITSNLMTVTPGRKLGRKKVQPNAVIHPSDIFGGN